MKITDYYLSPDERPLDRLVTDGGMTGIFRTIACVGDSLSSGEFEDVNADGVKTYHDMFDHSWGQHLGRMAGSKVYNFSRGGMSAAEYCLRFAEANGYWSAESAANAYIIALGVNDVLNNMTFPMGSTDDICRENWQQNKPTFAGYYAQIIQRYAELQKGAHFFLVTIPSTPQNTPAREARADEHARLMYALAEFFGEDRTHVIDLRQYAPAYDTEFYRNFFLGGHMNPAGYLLTAKMMASYIDYIIRRQPENFMRVGFIGTERA
ncbi:MAG: SGNH/GDSL hydrolase family protein [Clostridia bacterium]|nr:SGNH/GDSL hydrolase family protein [Clostridia bacterium]